MSPPLPPDRPFRIIVGLFALIALIGGTVSVVSLRNITRSSRSADWVNHTHALIAAVNEAVTAVRSAEAALQTYLQTGDDTARADYREQFGAAAEQMAVIKALANDDPDQLAAAEALESRLVARADHARELLRLKSAGDEPALRARLAEDALDHTSGDVRSEAARFIDTQTSLLTERDRQAFRQAQTARGTIIAGVALNALLLLGAAWLIRDDLAARNRAAALLARSNEELEALVRQRTAQLETSNRRLHAENLETRWANQALEHQLRYNSLIIACINEPVLVITKALNISRVNPAMVRASGWDTVDLVDHPLVGIVRMDTTDTAIDPLAEALRTGFDLRERPAVLVTSAGAGLPVRLSLFPLRDRDRVVGGVVTLLPSSGSAV